MAVLDFLPDVGSYGAILIETKVDGKPMIETLGGAARYMHSGFRAASSVEGKDEFNFFRFTPINILDNCCRKMLAKNKTELTDSLGTIEVDIVAVEKLNVGYKVTKYREGLPNVGMTVVRWAMKGKPQTHHGFSIDKRLITQDIVEECKRKDTITKFIFHYRSKVALEAEGVLPPFTSDDVSKMTADDLRDLSRSLLASRT